MALPQKKSRSITINEEKYRWLISRDDYGGIGLFIELYQNPAQKLTTAFSYDYQVVTPVLVREVILHALAQGYTPHKKGQNFGLPKNSPLVVVKNLTINAAYKYNW
ncbi:MULTISPECIES: hypothetical protein [unclassified Microcoleus]|uniref:hypothetical protein n=1 Tax=unclassified Microcoleus TaxID=2642155 RepID=UPI001DE93836|nr:MULTISPECIES: hypothetical protein [unclassified Microcoleus]MCC3456464.1 hypothetical protein [Microcoleus sp. PH2017_08_TRC_O_A]MCC3587828.1 hypothetical protein [Microcoleus sp. PH2017_30_WIL_O_A]MCC3593667.1 hypothetical protein [Microcoleus sp. PH2017_28_MFU_U_A]